MCDDDRNPDNDPMPSPSDPVRASVEAYGAGVGGVRRAHKDSCDRVGDPGAKPLTRSEREAGAVRRADGATVALGAGNRAEPDDEDLYRSPFERDADRVRHSSAFRRLAGKTQVFIAPEDDHLRTRLTHAIEVQQVGERIAGPIGLNTDLVSAAALAHDVGHSCCGHCAETALSPYLPDGFDHAIYGANVALAPLNLTVEVLDAVRCHSWRLPAPSTPEGEVISWADRIAYVCHDADDAIRAGIIAPEHLPASVLDAAGASQSRQLAFFVSQVIEATAAHGFVCMSDEAAGVLDEFRRFNYERIYLRPASVRQAQRAERMLASLVDFFMDAPGRIPDVASGRVVFPVANTVEAAAAAVHYVSSMTDRYAIGCARGLLGYAESELPRGV